MNSKGEYNENKIPPKMPFKKRRNSQFSRKLRLTENSQIY